MGILIFAIAGWIVISLIATPVIGRFLVSSESDSESLRTANKTVGATELNWLGSAKVRRAN